MSTYLGNIERILLEVVVKYLEGENAIVNNNCVLAFDGLMVLKRHLESNNLPTLLKAIQVYIKGQTGFNIEWAIKDMNEAYTEEDLKPFEFNCTNVWSSKYMNELDGYERKKQYMELFFAKVEKPKCRFVRADRDYTSNNLGIAQGCMKFREFNETELFQLMRNVLSGKVHRKGKPTSFMEEWITDANMLTVHRLANIPYNGTYDKSKRLMKVGEETVLNIFQGYHPLIKTVVSKKEQGLLIQPWLELAQEMCEGGNRDNALKKRCFVFFRNVLAKKIQEPKSKIGHLIILEGKQRVGKNVMINPVGQIFGSEQYFITSKFEDCFSEFATQWAGKLLIVMNECKARGKDYCGELKARITDIPATVNPKGKTRYAIDDFGQYIVFTNEENPVPIDVKSGEGRTISFKTGEKYLCRTSDMWWKPLCEYFATPKFLAALYNYLNNVDLSSYDFKHERKKVLTASYKRLIEANIPLSARALVYYLRTLLIHTVKDCTGQATLEQLVYTKIKRREIYEAFQAFARKEGVEKPWSAHAFYQSIRSLKLNIDDVTLNNNKAMGFNPKRLYQECIQRGYEHPDFTLNGFKKEEEHVDRTEFMLQKYEAD